MLLVAGRGRGCCPQQEDPAAGGGPGEVGGEALQLGLQPALLATAARI